MVRFGRALSASREVPRRRRLRGCMVDVTNCLRNGAHLSSLSITAPRLSAYTAIYQTLTQMTLLTSVNMESCLLLFGRLVLAPKCDLTTCAL